MKTTIAILLAAACNIAVAAPTTIYFNGVISGGSVVDATTKSWIDAPLGRSFSGSITFDGGLGNLSAGMSGPFLPGYYEASRRTDGPANMSMVSSFLFTYDGVSYAFPAQSQWPAVAQVTKRLEGPQSSYHVGVATGNSEVVTLSGQATYSSKGRSIAFNGFGESSWVGDPLRLDELPDLSLFDPVKSQLIFSDSGFSCAYVVEGCPDGAVFDDGGLNLFGTFNYISTAPFAATAVPEPGSLSLVLLGVAAIIRKRGAAATT
jgi:hypothetical protein